MAQVVLDRVCKEYPGGKLAVDNVSLEIESGELVVLVGPSGCGKSTLLRIIAGLEEITDGRLLINGAVSNDVLPQDRDVAMVFQSYALFPHLTVGQNISYGLKVRGGLTAGQIAKKTRDTAELLGLDGLLERKPSQLSGGQRQRVAMSRAMIRDPSIFLFDEPLSNLDAQLRATLRTEIKRTHKRLGKTTVYVTHDQIEAMTLADRIVVLLDGQVEQIGPADEIYDRPSDLFVARFIGTPQINSFAARMAGGRVEAEDGSDISAWPVVDATGASRPLAAALGAVAGLPENFTVGVRPEAALIVEEGGLEFDLDLVELTGPDCLVHLRGFGIDLCAVSRDKKVGDHGKLSVAMAAAGLHVFTPDGKRMDVGF